MLIEKKTKMNNRRRGNPAVSVGLVKMAETAETLRKKNICIARQPRPQGFSLKKWVGREKALASAGHVSPRTP